MVELRLLGHADHQRDAAAIEERHRGHFEDRLHAEDVAVESCHRLEVANGTMIYAIFEGPNLPPAAMAGRSGVVPNPFSDPKVGSDMSSWNCDWRGVMASVLWTLGND